MPLIQAMHRRHHITLHLGKCCSIHISLGCRASLYMTAYYHYSVFLHDDIDISYTKLCYGTHKRASPLRHIYNLDHHSYPSIERYNRQNMFSSHAVG